MECSHETASFRQVKGGRENTVPILKAKNFTGKKCQSPNHGVIRRQIILVIRYRRLWILGGGDKTLGVQLCKIRDSKTCSEEVL
jgi:hypothetical protein